MDFPATRHVLIGDEQDLPLLRIVLASLPPDSVGDIFLEIPDTCRPRLPTPAGITVRHLQRGAAQPPGVRACTALGSWVDEWVLDEHATAEGHAILVGMPGNSVVEQWCAMMLDRHPRLHLHRPRRMGAPL